ncbi:hypothetical protein K450DRAFT_262460 [Umbelopsis ramanniana AG]|uniref:DUF1275 domain protein n=1 Tax=Umbelopsis ramanniana AG TaxID=1314678 RepID=A0AAD5HA99_UMBRA|nr:uncharacterized protein K450DRAFT_262460 [Umbelopsis ramanniana AG]KAI8575296.1 hypothetical protein K450DRAFT_262460 [Umbelopsis ramanniana AG]
MMTEEIKFDEGTISTTNDVDSSNAFRQIRPHLNSLWQYSLFDLSVDSLVEFQLLLATFCTGLQDAISYPDFRCFASNQTGNTVVLAVGIANYNYYASQKDSLFHLPNIAMSLGMFLAGATITGQLGNYVGGRRRGWQFITNLAQTMMIFGAAGIQYAHDVQETGPWALAVVALLAFSSGAQVAAARAFRVQEITTAMATAAWVDLVIDPKLLKTKNHPRDRRALFLVALIAGGFAGAFMYSKIGSPSALVISATGKTLVTALMLLPKKAHEGSSFV